MGRPVVFSPIVFLLRPPRTIFSKIETRSSPFERLDQDYRATSKFTHDFRLIKALLTSTVKKSLEVKGGGGLFTVIKW